MSDRKNPRRSSGRRKHRRRNPGHSTPKDLAKCPICDQAIRDVLTAIIVAEDGTAAHFDCVVKKLASEEDLRNREKICYLGAGEFGIVRFHNNSDPSKFTIRKRIKLETKEHIPAWRKQISEGFSN